MKALLFSTLFLVAINFLNGQIPFAPVGARYMLKTECPPYGGPAPQVSEIVFETEIQGINCTYVGSWPGVTCEGNGYVFQDESKVFVYDEADEEFHLVYDFSKQVGESYKIKVCQDVYDTDSAKVVVETLSNYYFANGNSGIVQSLLIYPTDTLSWWQTLKVEIYEGIGGLHGNTLLFPFAAFTSCYTDLLCYWSPTTGSVSLLGDSQPCEPVSLKDKYNSNHFNVYPNPSAGDVFFDYDLPENFKKTDIRIFDSTGHLYDSFVLIDKYGEINLENLPTGFYFIVMTAQGRIIGTDKLIVVN